MKCEYCKGEGIVEMDNNGPIGDCPLCDGVGIFCDKCGGKMKAHGACGYVTVGGFEKEMEADWNECTACGYQVVI